MSKAPVKTLRQAADRQSKLVPLVSNARIIMGLDAQDHAAIVNVAMLDSTSTPAMEPIVPDVLTEHGQQDKPNEQACLSCGPVGQQGEEGEAPFQGGEYSI